MFDRSGDIRLDCAANRLHHSARGAEPVGEHCGERTVLATLTVERMDGLRIDRIALRVFDTPEDGARP